MLFIQRNEKNVILESDTVSMETQTKQIEEQKTQLNTRLAELDKAATQQEQIKLAQFRATWNKFLDTHTRVIQAAMENSNIEAAKLSAGKGRELANKCYALLDTLIERNNKEMDDAKTEAGRQYSIARNLLLAMLAVALVVGSGTAFWLLSYIVRSLTRPPPSPRPSPKAI